MQYEVALRQPASLFQSASRETRLGQDDVVALRRETATEKENLFFGFSINGDEIFCREAYESANGLLAHLGNVSALLTETLKVADLTRVEVHGPTQELEKLKAPLAHLNPAWFALEARVTK